VKAGGKTPEPAFELQAADRRTLLPRNQFFRHFLINPHPDRCSTKVEYIRNSAIFATTLFSQQHYSSSQRRSREGGNPGKVTVHGETISEIAKSLEDRMDGSGQSWVERCLRRDLRWDWIPAFETVS
jgi:hypothetical protein